jgi:hypothetical protein
MKNANTTESTQQGETRNAIHPVHTLKVVFAF